MRHVPFKISLSKSHTWSYHPILWILVLTGWICGCDNVDFNEEKNPEETGDSRPLPPSAGDTLAHTISEAQALFQKASSDTIVTIAGYIVGTIGPIPHYTLTFEAPFEEDTNILLADNPYERSISHCLPVRLEKGDITRDSLNLKDNPELKGRGIAIRGKLTEYYRVAGVKKIQWWSFVELSKPVEDEEEDVHSDRIILHPGREEKIVGGR